MGNRGVLVMFLFYFLILCIFKQASTFIWLTIQKIIATIQWKSFFPPLYPCHSAFYLIDNLYYQRNPPFFNYLVALGDKSRNIYFTVLSINTLWVHGRVFTNDLQNSEILLITWERFKYCLEQRQWQASLSLTSCRIKDPYSHRLHLAKVVEIRLIFLFQLMAIICMIALLY